MGPLAKRYGVDARPAELDVSNSSLPSALRTPGRFAVIGDVHLRRCSRGREVVVSADALIATANYLADTHDLVLVNGDLFDLDRGAIPLAFAQELSELGERHHRVVEAYSGSSFVWLRGNHDRELELRGRALGWVDLDLGCGRVRIEHGDRFDGRLKQHRTFTSLVTWANGRVQASGLRFVDGTMRWLDRLLTGASPHSCPVERNAWAWLRSSADHVGLVIGHTHRRLLKEVDGRTLVNPGGSCDVPRWASIDAVSGDVSLHAWEAEAPRVFARSRL